MSNIRLDNAIAAATKAGKFKTRNQALLTRAVMEVTDATFAKAVVAAEVLDNQGLTAHQVRTNYRAAGITFDMVKEALNNY